MKLLQELQAMSKGSADAKITIKSADEDYVPFYIKHHPNLKFTQSKGQIDGVVNLTVAGNRLNILNFLIKDMGYKNESRAVFAFPELKHTVKESLSSDLEDIIGMKTREATAAMKKMGFEKRNPPGGSKNELVYVGSNSLTNHKQKTIIFRAEDGVVKSRG